MAGVRLPDGSSIDFIRSPLNGGTVLFDTNEYYVDVDGNFQLSTKAGSHAPGGSFNSTVRVASGADDLATLHY